MIGVFHFGIEWAGGAYFRFTLDITLRNNTAEQYAKTAPNWGYLPEYRAESCGPILPGRRTAEAAVPTFQLLCFGKRTTSCVLRLRSGRAAFFRREAPDDDDIIYSGR